MNVRTAWICCLLAGTVIFHCEGIQWLGLFRHSRSRKEDSQPDVDPPRGPHDLFTHEDCVEARSEHGLKKRQFRFCKNEKFGGAMQSIMTAARLSIFHCIQALSDRRWNCSSALRLPRIRPDLRRGTREQAFLYAVASAAMIYTIARGCADGNLKYCTCDYIPDNETVPNSTYHWSDCHDNFEMAEKYVVNFLGIRPPKTAKQRRPQEYDSYQRSRPEDVYNRPPANRRRRHQKRKRRRKNKFSVFKMMNNHNYMAGIRIIYRHRKLVCKCHGVSGSCSVRTCSLHAKRLDDPLVLRDLRENYLKAVFVKRENNRLVPGNLDHKDPILPTDLVFVEHSPDYCVYDGEVGSFGTRGRICNVSVPGSINCRNMCCGRGYSIFTKRFLNDSCVCKFNPHIFKIECEACLDTVTYPICN